RRSSDLFGRPPTECAGRAALGWNEKPQAERSRGRARLRPPTECAGRAALGWNEKPHAGRSRGAPRLRPPTECAGRAALSTMTRALRLVVTVCPREPGVVRLPVERGGHAMRLDAAAILKTLQALVDARGLAERVRFCEACAGGCSADGTNVSVEIFPAPLPGER